jgi:hypothetical protein
MWDFKFSRRRVWCSELSSGMYCRVKLLSTDVSEVRTAFIIRDETSVDNHFTRQYIPEDKSEHRKVYKCLNRENIWLNAYIKCFKLIWGRCCSGLRRHIASQLEINVSEKEFPSSGLKWELQNSNVMLNIWAQLLGFVVTLFSWFISCNFGYLNTLTFS